MATVPVQDPAAQPSDRAHKPSAAPPAHDSARENGARPTAGASESVQHKAGAADHNHDDSDDDGDDDDAESLYEEIFSDGEAFEYSNDARYMCTPDEARAYRKRLHDVGANTFIFETITENTVTARKLCHAFGFRTPTFMEELPDEDFYKPLGLAISRELNKRPRLDQYKTIDDAAALLNRSRNIMVITGAGISTSLGIPDFRSKNTGFYSKLLALGFHEPEQVFDIQHFDEDPSVFYKLAGEILPDLRKWTPTHEFIRLLQEKNKLLTNYTQNIDNVEAHAGIRKEKLIQCHGSWATATCRKCRYQIPGEGIFDAIRSHTPAECPACLKELAEGSIKKRKRVSNGSAKKRRGPGDDDSDDDGAYDIPQPGIMKPDITFFGEALPSNFFDRLRNQDRSKVDLIIVMGTSMKVAPVSEVPNFVPRDVPQIYISRDPIHHINFDINLLGDCDTIVGELARRAGWTLKHKMLPEDQQVDVVPVDEHEHVYRVRVRQSSQSGNSENVASGNAKAGSLKGEPIKAEPIKCE